MVPFRHTVFAQGDTGLVAHAFFSLQEDRLRPAEPRPNLIQLTNCQQPDWGYKSRIRAVSNGVRNLGQQVIEVVLVFARDVDNATAEKKFAELAPELINPPNQPKG